MAHARDPHTRAGVRTEATVRLFKTQPIQTSKDVRSTCVVCKQQVRVFKSRYAPHTNPNGVTCVGSERMLREQPGE